MYIKRNEFPATRCRGGITLMVHPKCALFAKYSEQCAAMIIVIKKKNFAPTSV